MASSLARGGLSKHSAGAGNQEGLHFEEFIWLCESPRLLLSFELSDCLPELLQLLLNSEQTGNCHAGAICFKKERDWTRHFPAVGNSAWYLSSWKSQGVDDSVLKMSGEGRMSEITSSQTSPLGTFYIIHLT